MIDPEKVQKVVCPIGGAGCSSCQRMCAVPCWPTPSEAMSLMDRGYAPRLQVLKYWLGEPYHPVLIVCGANKGQEGTYQDGPQRTEYGCTFWQADGRCELHTLSLKPLEGRAISCEQMPFRANAGMDIHNAIGELWDTELGLTAVKRFAASAGIDIEDILNNLSDGAPLSFGDLMVRTMEALDDERFRGSWIMEEKQIETQGE